MMGLKEEGYEIIVREQYDMVQICADLCSFGYQFKAFILNGDWHIFLTGAF